MRYAIKILKKALKTEKYFGQSAAVYLRGKEVAQANAQLVRDRIPQLELAIKILSSFEKQKRQKSNKEYFISDNQLNLFL